ncbi:hypothetical protein [Bacteroides sp.]
MNIEELVNKYFEGKTTCEEERQLRQYFTEGMVPEHLEVYRPMFAFFNKENQKHNAAAPAQTIRKVSFHRRLIYGFSGLAACMLIILAIAGIARYFNPTPESYVIIDGECYTNAELVHEEALAAFQEVRLSEDEVFATLFSE